MSERFDWDVLLEERQNPQKAKRRPVEEEMFEDGPTHREPKHIEPPTMPPLPQKVERKRKESEVKGQKAEPKPEPKPEPKRTKVDTTKKEKEDKNVPAILQGKLTPEILISGFIMAEVLGPPGGLRKRKSGRYFKTKY